MKVSSFRSLSITAEQNCACWVSAGPIPHCLFVEGAMREYLGDLGLILVAIFHHFHLLWMCLAVKKIKIIMRGVQLGKTQPTCKT